MARYDIAVVGAGLAGLAAAALLASSRRRVIVLERDERPGGLMSLQSFQGLRFSPGPGASYGYEREGELFRLAVALNQPVPPSPGPSLLQVALPEHRITISSEPGETLDELRREFPREIDRAARLYHDARELRERSATGGLSSFLVKRRNAGPFLDRYRFSREMRAFLSVQALYFFGQSAETLSLSDLLLMTSGSPPLLKDGAQGVADRLRDAVIAAGGDCRFSDPWPELSLRKGRIASLRSGDDPIDARSILLNVPVEAGEDSLFLAVRRKAIPVGMAPTVLYLKDYERPRDIVAVTYEIRRSASVPDDEVVPVTASFLAGGATHDGQRDRLIERVRSLMPFVDDFVTHAEGREQGVRQVPLPATLAAALATARHDAMLVRPRISSNIAVLPDSGASLTRAVRAGRIAARTFS